MRSFELRRPQHEGERLVSLKVRVVSGCFHREHSPHAYALIDEHLASVKSQQPEFLFVEHESGPKLLAYLAIATAGATLAKSVIDLIVAIIKARSEGVKKGDRPSEPVEVIVRRVGDGDKFVEEKVFRISHNEPAKRAEIEARINDVLKRLSADSKTKTANLAVQRTHRKRRTANRRR